MMVMDNPTTNGDKSASDDKNNTTNDRKLRVFPYSLN
jgi:hypothetical protein